MGEKENTGNVFECFGNGERCIWNRGSGSALFQKIGEETYKTTVGHDSSVTPESKKIYCKTDVKAYLNQVSVGAATNANSAKRSRRASPDSITFHLYVR